MFVFYNSYFIRCSTSTCFTLVQFIQYVLLHVYMSVNVNGMYMYVNKRVELTQHGTAL